MEEIFEYVGRLVRVFQYIEKHVEHVVFCEMVKHISVQEQKAFLSNSHEGTIGIRQRIIRERCPSGEKYADYLSKVREKEIFVLHKFFIKNNNKTQLQIDKQKQKLYELLQEMIAIERDFQQLVTTYY